MESHAPVMSAGTLGASSQRAGLAFAGLCALNGAFVAPIARVATAQTDPLQVAVFVTLFAALAAAIVLGVRGRLGTLFRGRDAWVFAALGAMGTMVPNVLFFWGTARTSALDAALCLQTEPVISLLLAWLVLGHRLTLRRSLSAALLLIGIGVAATGEAARDPLGVAMLLATPIAWQSSHLLVLRRLPSTTPELLTGARYVWGGFWLGLVALVWTAVSGRPTMLMLDPRTELPLIAVQGVGMYYVGTMLWYQAISRLDLARATSIVVPSVPVLTLAVAYLLLGEVPSRSQLVGLCFMTVGVVSFVTAPHAIETRERVPTQMAPLAADAEAEAGGDAA